MAMSCGGSADTPTAVACAKASLKLLEVLPGLTMDELFRRGFEGIDGACEHPLSPDSTLRNFQRSTFVRGAKRNRVMAHASCGLPAEKPELVVCLLSQTSLAESDSR